MIGVKVQQYLGRARDFFKGMDFLKDDLARYRYSSALLGIHSAMSYSDALRVGMEDKSVSSDDHSDAARRLRKLLREQKAEDCKGVDHLAKLLGMKSKITYSAESSTEDEVKSIVQHATRFAAWAEMTGKRLKIEGWRDDRNA